MSERRVGWPTAVASAPRRVAEPRRHRNVFLKSLILLGIASVLPAAELAGASRPSRPHPVDTWMANHPDVAATLIWEFPPPAPPRPLPRIPFPRPIERWPFRSYDPVIAYLSPYTDLVLPGAVRDLILRDPVITEPRSLEFSGDLLTDSTVYALPTPVLDSPKVLKPILIPPGGVMISEYGAEIRAWDKWPDWAKEELRARYTDYRSHLNAVWRLYQAYAASGFQVKPDGFDAAFSSVVDADPQPVVDPPFNLQPDDLSVPGVPWTMLASADAFKLFVRLTAAQIALEASGFLGWSLSDYSPEELTVLFDGRRLMRYVTAGETAWGPMTATGHVLTAAVIPAPPLITLGFLAQHGILAADRRTTIVRLLDWERRHLSHTVGGEPVTPMPGGMLYFGYDGRAPISRMMNGTAMACPIAFGAGHTYFDPETRHWVAGCGGASGFNEEVLRLINIAAPRTVYGHFQNRFALGAGEYVGLCHADDPYGIRDAEEIPTEEILLDGPTFDAWFAKEADPLVHYRNIGRRVADLYLEYLPQVLLRRHCRDVNWWQHDHANSTVYTYVFSNTYTVEELEAAGLWTAIEAALEAAGGCSVVGY